MLTDMSSKLHSCDTISHSNYGTLKGSSYMLMSPNPQLDSSVWTDLKDRFRRQNSSVITDVYDGEKYKHHQRFLNSSPAHISFILNTDGVAIFRSSK